MVQAVLAEEGGCALDEAHAQGVCAHRRLHHQGDQEARPECAAPLLPLEDARPTARSPVDLGVVSSPRARRPY